MVHQAVGFIQPDVGFQEDAKRRPMSAIGAIPDRPLFSPLAERQLLANGGGEDHAVWREVGESGGTARPERRKVVGSCRSDITAIASSLSADPMKERAGQTDLRQDAVLSV